MAVLVLVNRNGTNFDEDVNCQSNPVGFCSEYATNSALGASRSVTRAELAYQSLQKSLQHVVSYDRFCVVCALFSA